MHDLRSKNYSEKKKKKIKHILILVMSSIFLMCICILYYAYATRFHIAHIIVSGTSLIDKQEVVDHVNGTLSHKLWGLIPLRSSLFVHESNIETSLRETFAPIDTLEIEVEGDALFITISERASVALFCNQEILCFFLNKDGVIFAEAPHFEGSSYIKYIVRTNDYTIGQTVMSADEVAAMIEKVTIFESFGLTLNHIEGTSQEVIEFVDSNQTRFIMTNNDTPATMRERLQAVISSRPEVSKGVFEYIDMTIESKIFLKQRES